MATITASDLAAELGTTGREVRKFLRADAKAKGTETPGKGSRYQIEKKHIAGLKKRYADWDEARKVKAEAPAEELTADEVKEIDEDNARQDDHENA